MNELRATAVVLRSVDYGEADRVVTFFTREHGKLTAFARAARKSRRRFGAALEPFQRLSIRYRDRRGDLISLAAADIEQARPELVADYDLVTRASYLTELASEATREREPHRDLFDLLDGGFDVLASPAFAAAQPEARDGWLIAFELKLMSLAGYRPRFAPCAACGLAESPRWRFSPGEGAVFCPDCAAGDGMPLTAGTAKLLEVALDVPLASLERHRFSVAQVEEARRLTAAFVRWQLGKELKSARFLSAPASTTSSRTSPTRD